MFIAESITDGTLYSIYAIRFNSKKHRTEFLIWDEGEFAGETGMMWTWVPANQFKPTSVQ